MEIEKNKKLSAAGELRRQAEERLGAETAETPPPRTEGELQRLVHELEVHRIELEMQNEELLRAQLELEEERNKYAELYDFAPVGYFTFTGSGLIREVNLAGAQLLGEEKQRLVNKPFSRFIADAENQAIFLHHLENTLQKQVMQRCEIQLTGKDGRDIHGQLQSVTVDPSDGNDGHVLCSIVDGTTGWLAERKIAEIIRQQQAILDNIPHIAWLKDRAGRYIAANDPFNRLFGVTAKELVGKNDFDIHPPELAVKHEKDSREVMATGRRTYFEESLIDPEGKTRFVEKIETPIFNDTGVVIGSIGIVHDITGRKKEEIALRYNSTHDILTDLYNRAFFDGELERLARGRMFPIGIVMADVNGLKKVNDTLGHEAGDNLLRLAARIILRAFRAEDIVARIGGDEFAVLLPNTTQNVAEKIVKKIKHSSEIIAGLVSIAFGVASAINKDQLAGALRLSDQRMYLDKPVKTGEPAENKG